MIKQLLFITFTTLSINAHGAAEYPLHDAVRERDFKSVEQILKTNIDINAKNDVNESPLYIAILNGYFEICELLINHGADPYAKNTDGEKPLDVATSEIRAKLEEYIDSLLEIKEPGVD